MHVDARPVAAAAAGALPALAKVPVAAVALGLTSALVALSGRYGYHRDELYFRLLADAPAWGYVDQPALTPLVARAAIEVFGDTVWALRVPAALLAGVLAALLALLAREVGGGRRAQVVAALGAASATPLISGHVLLTASLDWVLWVLAALLITRALVRGRPGYWVPAGAVVGVALLNKLLIVLLPLSLVAALLLVGPRAVLRSRWPWLAAAVAVAVGSPSIVYQLVNGVPQAEMVGSLTGAAARLLFVPGQALALGPPAVALWGAGLVAALRSPSLRAVRPLAVAYLVACGILLVAAGQFYYSVGFLLPLYAVGSVVADRWARTPRRERHLHRTVAINVATSAVVALPLLPVQVLGASPVPLMNPAAGDQVGWPVYAAQVAAVHSGLPPAERARSVVIADNYGEAGALDRYGPDTGLPDVVSGHNGLWPLARPADDVTIAVVVMQGPRAETFLAGVFGRCETAGRLSNGAGVENEEEGTLIRVCRDPVAPWAQLWPRFRYVGLSTFCEPCRRLDLA